MRFEGTALLSGRQAARWPAAVPYQPMHEIGAPHGEAKSSCVISMHIWAHSNTGVLVSCLIVVFEACDPLTAMIAKRDPPWYRRAGAVIVRLTRLQVLFDESHSLLRLCQVPNHNDCHVFRPIPAVIKCLDRGRRDIANDAFQPNG